MSKSVFSIATTHGQAERIVQQLQTEGFAASEISVLMPDTGGTRDVGHVKATKAPEGATTGAATGGATVGVIGLLAGIGALAIPGVGPFIAAGPIMGALSGAAVGAATGGVVGGLIGLGIPEIEAKRYEEKLLIVFTFNFQNQMYSGLQSDEKVGPIFMNDTFKNVDDLKTQMIILHP